MLVAPRVELDDVALAVERRVHLIGVHSRHDVRRGLADLGARDDLAGESVKRGQASSEPLGVVDELLVAVRP
jgi:hypothetical protein